MLSKFSVKKPYTVWVGVAMIIILGVVSVMNLVTDLLPSMNMPYSVVYTTYIGASSGEVEEAVTRPVESAMATVSNIKNMQSVSSDNLSLVILEFEDDANMDSITIEMRENLDQISAQWDDAIGSPVIMNINPDMLPIMIAAVDLEGKEGAELFDYVNNSITGNLESIEGVASVSTSGGIVESVQVTIDKDKLEKVNEEIRASLAKKFTDARLELEDARKKINDGLSEIDSASEEIIEAKNKISTSLSDLTKQLADAKNQTDAKQLEMIQTKIDLNKQLNDLLTQKASLEQTRAGLVTGVDPEPLADQIAQIDATLAGVNSGIDTLNKTLTQLEAGSVAIDQAKKEIEIQESDATLKLYTALIEANQGQAKLDDTKTGLEDSLEKLDDSASQIDDSEQDAYDKADLLNIVTEDLVSTILTAQNFNMPAGYANDDNEQVMVKVGNKITDKDELSALILMDMGLDDVDPVKLSDVATIEIIDNSDSVFATVNGRDSVLLTFEKQTGFSTGDVSDAILETFDELSSETEGLTFTVMMDQGVYIDYIVGSVFSNLLWGALFAIIILIFFLKSVKPTLIIAVSIPISLLAAIVLMYFSGININIISLSGLALAVGMLVDNSIVVIENIYRLRGEGVPIYKACVQGAKEVAGAIFASTLTTCCVFLPIVFTEGLTKSLFVDLGLTVTYSLMASLLIALTLVPAMSAGLLKKDPGKSSKIIEKMQDLYFRSIKFALKKKAFVVIFAVVALGASAYGAYLNGTSFMPSMENPQMSVNITVPEEYSFVESKEICSQAVESILKISDVETVGAMSGSSSIMSLSSGTGTSKGNSFSLYIILDEDKKLSNSEIKDEILNLTSGLDCEMDISYDLSEMTMMFGSGVSVKITGRDLDKLRNIAKDFAEKLESVEGLTDIDDGLGNTAAEFRITVNKSEASKYSLTVAQIYMQVAANLASSSTATTLESDTADIDVVVTDGEKEETTIEDIRALELDYTNTQGESGTVKLSDIADFELVDVMSSISRVNQTRTVTVSAGIEDGYNVGNVGKEIQEIIDDYNLSSGYSITLSGQNEQINDALEQLVLMLVLGVAFVYLVMVAQFQSLKMPFIIMFTIPLAFTGGFLGLIIGNFDISVISMLGFIILTGVIVNNGIVLVDYINQLRISGMEKTEAIAEAGRTRLRPILMTAITTILGLIMMALGVGIGADMVQPIAVVTIGGMIYGTLMTLWIVPCIYDIFTHKKDIVIRDVD